MMVLLGSARSDGKTAGLVRSLLQGRDYEYVDLLQEHIAPYNYDHAYPAEDSFHALAERMTPHESFLFATPVYWYAMSGVMKTFFDRLTDLITIRKPIGRKLAGRRGYVLATGTGEEPLEGFAVPFQRTFEYFDMTFGSLTYIYTGNNEVLKRQSLAKAREAFHDLS